MMRHVLFALTILQALAGTTASAAQEVVDRLNDALTLDERISLVHGFSAIPKPGRILPEGAIPGGGFVPGVARLGIPAQYQIDGASGVTDRRPGQGSTALPSALGLAATFNPELAYASGAMIGSEARAKGFNVVLAGTANLARDPRGGRNFENLGEDPWLTGVMAGEIIQGVQSNAVTSTIKHFALNDQESARHDLDARIDEAGLRESDLLAFELAIERGKPGAVMCAYNQVNGSPSCASDFLLNQVLKGDWSYPGPVISDWGAVGATDFALKGLDQQSGSQIDRQVWFGDLLKQAVLDGHIPQSRLVEMTRRILHGMASTGALYHPAGQPEGIIDTQANLKVARRVAQEALVLLRNERNTLPLKSGTQTILVVGGRADFGVLSGGGSSQVVAADADPRSFVKLGGEADMSKWGVMHFQGSSPLAAIRARAPQAQVRFYDGRYPGAAAQLARQADVVIVFVNQWMAEGEDAPDLSLPDGQDALIEAVSQANPNTVVVLQTGGAIAMPWLKQTAAVLASWYSGADGANAIGDVLFGHINPSGRLPVTFPAKIEQYPRAVLTGWGVVRGTPVTVSYPEGADVGYRWLAKTGEQPLFAFGYGLSYTNFDYTDLKVDTGNGVTVTFDVKNNGPRAGNAVPQVYLTEVNGRTTRRLLGFAKPSLESGERQQVSLTVDPRLLAQFDVKAQRWVVAPGQYRFALGPSSIDTPVSVTVPMQAWSAAP
ncbi:glycoside hydrolase family 3 C-terminal domain-containing protein [Pseudomonas sp. 21LCFQ02]|uniref:beta-glucosidase n=1 Tax=Pseudomonas sp. 21LCFQ02 TaxID=2957505 RepID=UPI00209AB701|nr:glycoside hydrolase family 3 C-terminal domain-containing protein [Pseudomonas sp. 21LCFQ02]MCO8167519.1 glycoside hydrolase family 3 C-terminal domain-containing protein [Pseudomonas sp. 21LCFQ02]